MKHNVYLYCGSIYSMNGCIIEEPALLIDKSDGCIHGYGDAANLRAKFAVMANAYNQAGMNSMADDLMLLEFAHPCFGGLSKEEVCYILRRAVEYTATSFQPGLVEHCMKPDFREWLQKEMKRVPIDLAETEF